MAAPFTFLDRVDAWVGGPGAVLDALRSMVLPGGDRPVTRAGDASRIPEAHVRTHVVDVALGIIQERVREGLTAALAEHLAAVREEFEMMEGDVPIAEDVGTDQAANDWWDGLAEQIRQSLKITDLDTLFPEAAQAALHVETSWAAAPNKMADAVLAAPVTDPAAVLERAGVRSADVDALVAEIRAPIERDVSCPGWSIDWLGTYLSRAGIDPALAQEGVAYVLTDPDMVATGAELLGLAGDETFASWTHGRLVVTSDEENAAAVAQVLRAAGLTEEGGDDTDTQREPISETAAGGEGGKPSAAQPVLGRDDAVVHTRRMDLRGPSALTEAVSAALAALFDHGCESDKAMAAALGVERSVVAGARKRTAPWAPDDQQIAQLQDLMWKHMKPITDAFEELKKTC